MQCICCLIAMSILHYNLYGLSLRKALEGAIYRYNKVSVCHRTEKIGEYCAYSVIYQWSATVLLTAVTIYGEKAT